MVETIVAAINWIFGLDIVCWVFLDKRLNWIECSYDMLGIGVA